MKILYHHRIASKDGQYVHVEELTNALKEHNHELCFVCPKFSEGSDFGSEGGIAGKLKAALPKWIYEILELSYSLIISVKLIRAILRFKPDFIYERYNLYQPAGVIVARLFRLPILMEVNAPLVEERSKYSGLALVGLARAIEKFTWKNSTFVLPVTGVLAEKVAASGVERKKITVIHNGINKNVLDRLDAENRQPDQQRKIVVGFTGFIHPWHRLDLALNAIAELQDKSVHFICVGEGDIRADLEQQAVELGIQEQVLFTGLVSREEVFNYVSQFDIALQPNVTEYASPLKLFEYLAAGSIVIAPDMDNIREILDNNSALLFEPGNASEFQQKLMHALENFSDLEAMRISARRLIDEKRFTWQENAERVVDLIEGYC